MSETRTAKIYALSDADGRVRYVGTTIRPLKTRLHGHFTKCDSDRVTPVVQWLRGVNRDEVTINLLETCDEAVQYQVEREWIRTFKEAGYELLNSSEYRNKGWNFSQEQKNRIASVTASQWADPVGREKKMASLKRHWASDEVRKNASERAIQRHKDNPEIGRKKSESHKKLWQDPEFRASQIKRINSPEQIEIRRENTKNAWKDDEHRSKRAAAIRAGLNKMYQCGECDFKGKPNTLASHRKKTGHSGKIPLDTKETS